MTLATSAASRTQQSDEMLFWIGERETFTLYRYDVLHHLLAPVTTSPDYRFLNPPALSPDGRHIIYEVDREGERALFVVRTDGAIIYESSRDRATRLPIWSPRGDVIAYWETTDGFWHFYLMNPDGSESKPISDEVGLIPYTYPLWSPDGRYIFFKLWTARYGTTIYLVEVQTGFTRNLTPFLSASGDLSWSPDGRYLIYRSERDRNGEIYALDVDTEQVVNLTRHPAVDFQPAWSPDGKQIAFVSTRNGRGEIHIMGADGSQPRQISSGGGWLPIWSPDGQWIAYVSRQNGRDALYITPSQGGITRHITALSEQYQFLGWFSGE